MLNPSLELINDKFVLITNILEVVLPRHSSISQDTKLLNILMQIILLYKMHKLENNFQLTEWFANYG